VLKHNANIIRKFSREINSLSDFLLPYIPTTKAEGFTARIGNAISIYYTRIPIVKKRLFIYSLLAVLILSGCGTKQFFTSDVTNASCKSVTQGIIDRSSESKSDFKAIQNDVYSDIALLMAPKVGLSYIHTKDRKLNYPIGYGGAITFYLTQTIHNPDTKKEDLVKTRDEIVNIFDATVKSILREIKNIDIKDRKIIRNYKTVINNNTLMEFSKLAKLVKQYGLYIRINNCNSKKMNSNTSELILATLTNGDREADSKFSFSIYNGLKFSSLFVGSDIMNFWDNVTLVDSTNNRNVEAQMRLITGILQVKDVLHFEVSNYIDIIKTSLNAKLKNLDTKLAKSIYKQVSLDIESIYSQIKNAGSASYTSESKLKVYKIPEFLKGKNDFESIRDYVESKNKKSHWFEDTNDSWNTFGYIDVNVKNLKQWVLDIENSKKNKINRKKQR